MLDRVKQYAKGFLWFFLASLGVGVAHAVADRIQPLRDLGVYFDTHPTVTLALVSLAIGLAVTGVVTLIASPFVFRLPRTSAKRPRNEISLAQVKAAWRRRGWESGEWRLFGALMAGLLLLLSGVFGLAFVVGPPLVKLVSLAVLLFLVVRLPWSLWRAASSDRPRRSPE